MTDRRLHAIIRGYVQGVGYRVFALREAQRLSLAGWVRNRSDGSVEVTAEGPEATLRQLLTRLEQGPSESEVAHVDVGWGDPTGEFAGFDIR